MQRPRITIAICQIQLKSEPLLTKEAGPVVGPGIALWRTANRVVPVPRKVLLVINLLVYHFIWTSWDRI